MYAYDDELLPLLKPELGEAIYQVGLGAHDFQFSFGGVRLQNVFRVDFCLQDIEYTWEGGACAIPAWLLVGQVPNDAELDSATALRIIFASGDWLRLHTDEGPYESQTLQWPDRDGKMVLQIY
jgi:hypothetical protein